MNRATPPFSYTFPYRGSKLGAGTILPLHSLSTVVLHRLSQKLFFLVCRILTIGLCKISNTFTAYTDQNQIRPTKFTVYPVQKLIEIR
jgi:hypothetical protein